MMFELDGRLNESDFYDVVELLDNNVITMDRIQSELMRTEIEQYLIFRENQNL